MNRRYIVRPVFRADSDHGAICPSLEAALDHAIGLADEGIACIVALESKQTPEAICPGRLARQARALLGATGTAQARTLIANLDRSPAPPS